MGPVLILATLFSLVEKLAGTSGDFGEGVEGMGCTMSGGLVIGSTGIVKGELSLSSGGDWVAWSSLFMWCHFHLSESLLWSLPGHLFLAIGLTCKPCPVFCSC